MTKDDIYAQLGKQIADCLAKHWGGQLIYFPKGAEQKLSPRDLEIYARYNGSNHAELAREYAVSLRHIYHIVKAVNFESKLNESTVSENAIRRYGKVLADRLSAINSVIVAANHTNDSDISGFRLDRPILGGDYKAPEASDAIVRILSCGIRRNGKPASSRAFILAIAHHLAGAEIHTQTSTPSQTPGAAMKPRYFTREVTATKTFLACAHCGVEQPAEYDGVLARHCISCSQEITHNELCPHCHTAGSDDELALFGTFKFCPICGGALNRSAA